MLICVCWCVWASSRVRSRFGRKRGDVDGAICICVCVVWVDVVLFGEIDVNVCIVMFDDGDVDV